MRFAVLSALSILVIVTQSVPAQSVSQPGVLAQSVLPSLDARPLISDIPSQNSMARAEHHEKVMHRLWLCSMGAVLASTSFDAATSWGKREGNGLLASSNGEFGMRGVSIKTGMAAAVIIPQLLLRKHKDLRGKFMLGNFAEAGIFTGVSIHNLHVTAQSN